LSVHVVRRRPLPNSIFADRLKMQPEHNLRLPIFSSSYSYQQIKDLKPHLSQLEQDKTFAARGK
jgi:hypothetical protein